MLLNPRSPDELALQCQGMQDAERLNLEQLMEMHGIAMNYISYSGEPVDISFEDRVAILCLKLPAILHEGHLDPMRVLQQLRRMEMMRWSNVLPSVTVLSAEVDGVRVCIPDKQLEDTWLWELQCEGGHVLRGAFVPGRLQLLAEEASFACSLRYFPIMAFRYGELPMGYHQFMVTHVLSGGNAATGRAAAHCMSLIATPAHCHQPQWLRDGERLWGLAVQLYSMRSARNWGVGDFSDLQALIRASHAVGASFVLLNPLHALDLGYPDNCSPYSPGDRRRLNVLYIDPAQEQEFSSPDLQIWLDAPEQQQLLHLARTGELIDYCSVSRFKMGVLARMYWHFLVDDLEQTRRGEEFRQFVEEQGDSLLAYASFEAQRLADRSGTDADQDPRFHMYLQWLAERQLDRCRLLTLELGMKVGLVLDLAVGSSGNGAEVMLNRDLFCANAAVGAPPDPLAPHGQNWGLPPMDPAQLHAGGYAHFSELLRKNMMGGGLRIDHVMALMRLWWCPRYDHAGVGAYVHYPVHDLFALLRLESQRNQCLIIGEDLGIVPPEVRERMRDSGIFSNTLFYFEKYDGGGFRAPVHHAKGTMLAAANHDVPPLAAWWNMSDLQLRRDLALLDSDGLLEAAKSLRRTEKESILRLLQEQWLLPETWRADEVDRQFDGALCEALLRCCARSTSQLLCVQLEDIGLVELPVNIPGTNLEYPNWRRRLPMTEALFGTEEHPAAVNMAASITRER